MTDTPELPGGFAPETFARRRRAVLDRLDGGVMVLPAAPVRYASRDTEYPYRPDAELYYLTGIVEPGAVALLRAHADEDPFVLFVRERDEEAERWSGPRPGPDAARERYGADAAHPLRELEERFGELVKGTRTLHVRLTGPERIRALTLEALETARSRGARAGDGPRSVVDPGEILDELRVVKEEGELERIRRAAAITVEAFREMAGQVAPGTREAALQARLESGFLCRGAGGPAFNTIVGSGANACTIHYQANDGLLPDDSQVLVDAGARVDLYHGDVTRTFPTSGRFGGRIRDVYAVVLEAQARALDAVAPGATPDAVHRAALEVMVDGLLELGVLRGDREELLEDRDSHTPVIPHRTSHWLGLDVHDPGDYARDGKGRTLEPGMVLTVEPGIYVPAGVGEGDGDDVPGPGPGAGAFAGIGVRIEDDVVVTVDGHENLTADLPRTAEAVEEMTR